MLTNKPTGRIANEFTKVVTSFVSDVVLPVVSLLPFLNRNMDQKFAILSKGPNFEEGKGYNTVKQARDDGALVLAWGYVSTSKKKKAPKFWPDLITVLSSRLLSTLPGSALHYLQWHICTCSFLTTKSSNLRSNAGTARNTLVPR